MTSAYQQALAFKNLCFRKKATILCQRFSAAFVMIVFQTLKTHGDKLGHITRRSATLGVPNDVTWPQQLLLPRHIAIDPRL